MKDGSWSKTSTNISAKVTLSGKCDMIHSYKTCEIAQYETDNFNFGLFRTRLIAGAFAFVIHLHSRRFHSRKLFLFLRKQILHHQRVGKVYNKKRERRWEFEIRDLLYIKVIWEPKDLRAAFYWRALSKGIRSSDFYVFDVI